MANKEIKNHHYIRSFIFIIILLIALIIVYGMYIGNSGLIVKEYDISNKKIPSSFNDIKIAHFADILYDSKNDIDFFDNLVDKINSKDVDIIIFSGDLIKKNYKLEDDEITSITTKLYNLNAKLGKYYVSGKNDKDNQKYDDIMKKAEFISLNNSYDNIFSSKKEKIQIYGLNTSADPTYITDAEKNNENTYKIVVFHESDKIEDLDLYGFDLALSSNSLNGQINIPVIKEFFIDDDSKNYYKPYYKLDNQDFYITSGIGTKDIDFRLLNKPSFNIYTLKKIN